MGSKENFDLLYQLADALGGSVAATRPPVDEDWID
ncbi:MAG TPA: electron transfer flavoprotein subunit alpha/FixB family protein, partial [Firmicutes bacterium]|nr:electron transfer flavoprotein subunit alpha/FixB family protein [Bacillota bacterium]